MRISLHHASSYPTFRFKDKGLFHTHHMMGVDFIFSKLKTRRARMLALMIVFMLFSQVRGELAVGLFGARWAGN